VELSGMELPGGLLVAGQRLRDFRFAPVSGALELILAKSLSDSATHPGRVTQVLCEALETLAGAPVTQQAVRSLSVGDRQYLMRQLSALLEPGLQWQTTQCSACGELFEISYEHAALPVKPAGAGFPRVQLETARGKVWVRSPTGEDQEYLASAEDDQQTLALLLARLVSRVEDGVSMQLNEFGDEDLAMIEQMVEDISPEITTQSQSHCPHCDAVNLVEISPYACLERSPGSLFEELHTLALHYHWSEQAILDLPQSRRHTYLNLIDRSRGMYRADAFIQQIS
jgi:hypothetical protein